MKAGGGHVPLNLRRWGWLPAPAASVLKLSCEKIDCVVAGLGWSLKGFGAKSAPSARNVRRRSQSPAQDSDSGHSDPRWLVGAALP